MLAVLTTVLALQVAPPQSQRASDDSIRDASRAAAGRSDSLRDARREARRLERLRRLESDSARRDSAFVDVPARVLFNRAREARVEQDQSLRSYDVKVAQRLSVGLSFRAASRNRLLARYETSARIRWQRDVGAWVDVTGKRIVLPMFVRHAMVPRGAGAGMITIPYYPGRDRLWPYEYMQQDDDWDGDDPELVHPLDPDGERFYRYESGDAMTITLPDGTPIRLRELRITARRPSWRLIVGSFWFDVSNANLVRAAYRPARPFDIVKVAAEEGRSGDDIPAFLKPMVVTVKSVTVEYGLHEGQWWLPRIQGFEGEGQVSFARSPVSYQESFRYESVNGDEELPAIPIAGANVLRATDDFDLDIEVERKGAGFDVTVSEHGDQRRSPCTEQSDTLLYSARRFRGGLPLALRLPCDSLALLHSPDLPPSIFDAGEEVFGAKERDELIDLLDLGLQAEWSPQPRAYYWGLQRGLLRYNRVEGLSAGAAAEQSLGRGLVADGLVRLGVADWEPNAEVHLSRTDARHTVGVGLFRRLAVANDWGAPLGLGASLNALLFARDEGFYYRSWGVEATGTYERGARVGWRAFVERHSDAPQETNFSLVYAVNRTRFVPNIDATNGWVAGAASRYGATLGLDPHGWRLITDLRTEGGVGDFHYLRGALDATVSHALGSRLDGALTLSGGVMGGTAPRQRWWYLGGSHTVRGQDPATAVGDAFWMARVELGGSMVAARPVVFYDMGWAGRRHDWQHPGRPIAGAGVGASILDGLIRFDVAKGIRPNQGVRVDLYLEARF